MKKITLLFLLFVGISTVSFGQAQKQLNIGFIGASLEIPVASAITVAPTVFTNLNLSYLTLGVKGNYYIDELISLNPAWDIYGGLNAGYGVYIGNDVAVKSGLGLGGQIGARWFWNEKWGVYAEASGGGLGVGAGLGVTMKL